MNALEIKNLTKTYQDFRLENLTLTLPTGCIMGLIGENGAGKSTTIKLILNMIHKESGSITILGKDNQENISLIKEDVGVVMDEVGFPECLTAKQVGKIMKDTYRNWEAGTYQEYLKKMNKKKGEQKK
jgi:ABC-2 type transport system ATP-binding protein